MRYLMIVLAVGFLVVSSNAQTRGMMNRTDGRAYDVKHVSRTNIPHLIEAEQLFKQRDFEAAFFSLENAVAQNPNSPEALLLRAKLKKSIGMMTEASEDLRLALRYNPYVADIYGYNGANGLQNIFEIEPEDAMTNLNTSQKMEYYFGVINTQYNSKEIEEEKVVALENLIDKIEQGDLIDALYEVEEIVLNYPKSAIARDLEGLVLTKLGNFYAAQDAFEKALELDATFAIAWYNLGHVERLQGHFASAKEHLDTAIALQEGLTKAYFDRAMVLKAMGNKEAALQDYNRIIELTGENYLEAFINRGLTKKMTGDLGGALDDLDRAIAQHPNETKLFKNRGNIYLLVDQPMKAVEDYTKALQLDPHFSQAYYNRGLAHFILYDKVSGCSDLTKSIKLGNIRAEKIQQYFCP